VVAVVVVVVVGDGDGDGGQLQNPESDDLQTTEFCLLHK
jgi:hypothetical protein